MRCPVPCHAGPINKRLNCFPDTHLLKLPTNKPDVFPAAVDSDSDDDEEEEEDDSAGEEEEEDGDEDEDEEEAMALSLALSMKQDDEAMKQALLASMHPCTGAGAGAGAGSGASMHPYAGAGVGSAAADPEHAINLAADTVDLTAQASDDEASMVDAGIDDGLAMAIALSLDPAALTVRPLSQHSLCPHCQHPLPPHCHSAYC